MFRVLRCAIIFGSLHLSVPLEEDHRDQILSQETVDAILQILSPRCQVETKAALDSQYQLSMDCKLEIQGVIPDLLTSEDRELHRKQQEREERDINSSDRASPSKKRDIERRKNTDEALDSESDPAQDNSSTVFVGGLIFSIIAGIIGIMMYIKNSNVDDVTVLKQSKKIEKKKVR